MRCANALHVFFLTIRVTQRMCLGYCCVMIVYSKHHQSEQAYGGFYLFRSKIRTRGMSNSVMHIEVEEVTTTYFGE